jgi:hypothetical protein
MTDDDYPDTDVSDEYPISPPELEAVIGSRRTTAGRGVERMAVHWRGV